MCAVIALIAFGLMKLALKISSAVTKKKILSYSRPSEGAASAYLCACFGEGNVLSGVWLPCLDRLERKMYAEVGDIIVLSSGIYIVNISTLMGRVFVCVRDRQKKRILKVPFFRMKNSANRLKYF